MCARTLGKTADGEQLYPTYADFETTLRERFWKDADEQIKRAQWEKLRQVNFKDGDKFFQKFEELAFYAGVLGNKQVMLPQVKKAARETSKNTIYSANRELPTSYQSWKARLLRMDYNGRLKQAEGTGCIMQKVTTPQKGGQTLTNTKTASGMTYGGQGVPMDISTAKIVAKCY